MAENPHNETALTEAMTRDVPNPCAPSGANPIAATPLSSDNDQSPNRLLFLDGQSNITLKKMLIEEWAKTQKTEDGLRRHYANWVLGLVVGQVVIIALVTVSLGLKKMELDAWTIRTLLISVFLELAAIMGVVTRYLFEGRNAHLPHLLSSMDNREHIRHLTPREGPEKS